jgi:hypothetical protein
VPSGGPGHDNGQNESSSLRGCSPRDGVLRWGHAPHLGQGSRIPQEEQHAAEMTQIKAQLAKPGI